MKITITKRLEFDAGHRVYKHESKCRSAHGHRYVCELTAKADKLDSLGRIIDFSIIKSIFGKWLDDTWDHSFLIFREDIELIKALTSVESYKPMVICDWNPTAENMASFLLEKANSLLKGSEVEVTKIRLFETPTCWADASIE